jgi:hypothetical protein
MRAIRSVRLRLCLAAFSVLLVFPAAASAIKCAPPGNSDIDQYFATVPGSVCNFPASGPGGGSHGSLPTGTRSQLSAQGPVGHAVERLVSGSNANASNGTDKNPRGQSSVNRSGAGAALTASGRGTVSGLFHPLLSGSSSGGVGLLLPIFLVGALVLAVGVVALRRIRDSSGPQP